MLETSAKTATNVDQAFTDIARMHIATTSSKQLDADDDGKRLLRPGLSLSGGGKNGAGILECCRVC